MRIQFLPDGSLFVLIITNKVVINVAARKRGIVLLQRHRLTKAKHDISYANIMTRLC